MKTSKHWTDREDKYLVENFEHKTDKQIAAHLNRSAVAVQSRRYVLFLYRTKEYVYYRNDKPVAQGTLDEIEEQTGLKRSTLYNYASPSARKHRKTVLVKL